MQVVGSVSALHSETECQYFSCAVQACRGQGVRLHMRPLGPGMMQQIQVPCDTCSQTGYQVPKNDACPSCSSKVRTSVNFEFEA